MTSVPPHRRNRLLEFFIDISENEDIEFVRFNIHGKTYDLQPSTIQYDVEYGLIIGDIYKRQNVLYYDNNKNIDMNDNDLTTTSIHDNIVDFDGTDNMTYGTYTATFTINDLCSNSNYMITSLQPERVSIPLLHSTIEIHPPQEME